MHALGLEFGSAAQLSKRLGSVWNCLWGNALKGSPGIIRKSRVSYPDPGFLSSATWPSLPKKHYNGLNQTKPNDPVMWGSVPLAMCSALMPHPKWSPHPTTGLHPSLYACDRVGLAQSVACPPLTR